MQLTIPKMDRETMIPAILNCEDGAADDTTHVEGTDEGSNPTTASLKMEEGDDDDEEEEEDGDDGDDGVSDDRSHTAKRKGTGTSTVQPKTPRVMRGSHKKQ